NWDTLGTERMVSFTALSQGTYKLKVKGTNSNKQWNPNGIELDIIVLPPPWKTWWAYTLYIIAFTILLIYGRYLTQKQLRLKSSLEKEQQERKRGQQLATFKETLFTNISHEFRTPLTLIIGPVTDFLRTNTEPTPMTKTFRMLNKQSRRMLRLLNQLLDYEKWEIGSLSLTPISGDLVSFSKDIFNMFEDEADRRKMQYVFQSDVKGLDMLFDHDKMDMILFNLLSNAFKYTNNNGKILFKITTNNQFVSITVSDNGKGIMPEDHTKIFNRFYRVTQNENPSVHSSGIGLFLVKEMVLLHSGVITVESNGHTGSSFIVTLPIKKV
ncbi:MAG: ATP-binding protein, partial [Niabella sp.]